MISHSRYLLSVKSNGHSYGIDPLTYYGCLLLDQNIRSVAVLACTSVAVNVCIWLDKSNSRFLTGNR